LDRNPLRLSGRAAPTFHRRSNPAGFVEVPPQQKAGKCERASEKSAVPGIPAGGETYIHRPRRQPLPSVRALPLPPLFATQSAFVRGEGSVCRSGYNFLKCVQATPSVSCNVSFGSCAFELPDALDRDQRSRPAHWPQGKSCPELGLRLPARGSEISRASPARRRGRQRCRRWRGPK
jgi:hypothetical protein